MTRLNLQQEGLYTRMRAMKTELNACANFTEEDCPLLDSQLQEAILFAERFAELARKLRKTIKHRSEP
jgi:hypothetical protein